MSVLWRVRLRTNAVAVACPKRMIVKRGVMERVMVKMLEILILVVASYVIFSSTTTFITG